MSICPAKDQYCSFLEGIKYSSFDYYLYSYIRDSLTIKKVIALHFVNGIYFDYKQSLNQNNIEKIRSGSFF